MREHFDPEWYAKVKDNTPNLSPESKAKIEARQSKEAERKAAMNRLAQTEDGRLFFKWLMTELGFKQSIMTMKQNGDAATDIMLCKEAQRNIWDHLRKDFNVDVRNKIEEDTDAS